MVKPAARARRRCRPRSSPHLGPAAPVLTPVVVPPDPEEVFVLPLPTRRAPGPHRCPLVVSVTRLTLRRWRDVPALVAVALRLRHDVLRSPGAVAVRLYAQPLRRTFWTVTAWTDEDALRRYAAGEDHARAVRRFRPHLAGSASARTCSPDGTLPTTGRCRALLDTATVG